MRLARRALYGFGILSKVLTLKFDDVHSGERES